MILRLMLLGFILSSCTTIYPRVSDASFSACWKLCKKLKGLNSVQINLELDYLGRPSIGAEVCNCNDKTQIYIWPDDTTTLFEPPRVSM